MCKNTYMTKKKVNKNVTKYRDATRTIKKSCMVDKQVMKDKKEERTKEIMVLEKRMFNRVEMQKRTKMVTRTRMVPKNVLGDAKPISSGPIGNCPCYKSTCDCIG